MKDGAPKITAKEEELGPGGNDITRVAGRSLVGSLNNGQLMFSTVSGFRDNHSQGAKFETVVEWLKGVGVKDAVNFDGGASVNMIIGNLNVSDGPGSVTDEKAVATALLVKDDRPKLYPASASWSMPQTTLTADGKSGFELSISFSTPSGSAVPDGTPVRFFATGVRLDPPTAKTAGGKVKARVYSVRRPGKAVLTAVCGPVSTSKALTLNGGDTKRVLVKLLDRKKVKEGTQQLLRVNAKVALTDAWGNPVANDEITVEVDGSQPYPFKTDDRGLATLEVDTQLSGGTVKVNHASAGSVPLKIDPLP